MTKGTGKRNKRVTIKTLILATLGQNGPMELKNITKAISFPRRSVQTKALELRRQGLVQVDDNGFWLLAPSAAVATHEERDESTTDTQAEIREEVLDPAEQFALKLTELGVKKDMAEILTQHFFNGNIKDMKWLYNVLCHTAKGFVTTGQARFMMGWWALWYGLRYEDSDFFDG